MTTRFRLLLAAVLAGTLPGRAQTPGVGIGTTTPTAPLHVASPQSYQVNYGPNIAGQATITASRSGNTTTLAPANAVDGNATTYWGGVFRQPFPYWLQLDFGATPRVIRQYTVYLGVYATTGTYAYAAGLWDFQASQDGTTWTTLHRVTSIPASRTTVLTYTVRQNATAYRYYRLLINGSTYALAPSDSEEPPTLAEWGVMEETGTAGVALRVAPGALQLQDGPAVTGVSLDPALGASDELLPTQRAVKQYVDAAVAAGADNLGNHTATRPLNLNGNILTGSAGGSLYGGPNGLYLNGAGQLGLGTYDPRALLAMRGGHNVDGTGGAPALAFEWWGGGLRHWLVTRHNTDPSTNGSAMDFYLNTDYFSGGSSGPGQGSAQVLTLLHENGPRVGIGTTAPGTMLDVSSPGGGTLAQIRGSGAWSQLFVSNTQNGNTTTVDLGSSGGGGYVGTNSAGDFAVRSGATTRITVKDGTGFVGIGTTTPAQKLDVAGTAQAQQFQYATAQTRYLTVPAAAFVPASAAYHIAEQIYQVTGLVAPLRATLTGGTAGQPGYAQAAVNLPDGAVVTGISFTAFDNDGTAVAPLASLTEVRQWDNNAYGNYFNISGGQVALTAESGNWQTVTTPLAMTIDNSINTYQLVVRLNQNSPNTGFLNVRIAYTVAKPD